MFRITERLTFGSDIKYVSVKEEDGILCFIK